MDYKRECKNVVREKKNISVTAPTGIAAINVNGVILSIWGGFGLAEYY